MALRPKLTHTTLGGLNAHVIDAIDDDGKPAGPPQTLVVLCHGYGAPGSDLVGLGPEILTAFPSLAGSVRFVFPEAPNAMPGIPFGGRAWWEIDMVALEAALAAGTLRDMSIDVPKLPPARKLLRALVEEALNGANLDYNRLVIGGFSQGSMLATDLALRLDDAPAALAIFSGTLFDKEGWTKAAPRRKGLKVIQAHGRQDPVLPYMGAELLRDLMTDAGLDVDFLPFDGGHTISAESLRALGGLLEAMNQK